MAELKSEIMDWLQHIEGDPSIGIDDGGLTLQTVDGSSYFEIGGIPDPLHPEDYVDEEKLEMIEAASEMCSTIG